jgi:hypothetical protein
MLWRTIWIPHNRNIYKKILVIISQEDARVKEISHLAFEVRSKLLGLFDK